VTCLEFLAQIVVIASFVGDLVLQ